MRSFIPQAAFILAVSLGVFSFVRSAQRDQRRSSCQALCLLRPTYSGSNRTAPEFELPDKNGKKIKFSSFLGGKPVVLNFWTKTCKPCLEELPDLAEMASILANDGVKVVTICTDENYDAIRDTLSVVLKLPPDAPLPFELLFDPDSEVVNDLFGTTLYPETWLIDGRGVIRARVDGNPEQRGMKWSDAIPREVVEMIGRPGGCPVEYALGKPVVFAELCEETL